MSEPILEKRDQMIAALDYPRLLMGREIKQRACSEHYRFNEQVAECSECLYILECQSYSKQLAAPTLRRASSSELLRLLRFGLEYVSYQLNRQDHDTAQCACDQCAWIRSVTPLLDADAANAIAQR